MVSHEASGAGLEVWYSAVARSGVVGVQPMAGVLQSHEAGGGKQAANGVSILRANEIRPIPGNEQSGPHIGGRRRRLPPLQIRQGSGDLLQPDAPGWRRTDDQIAQQKRAQGSVRDGSGQGRVGRGTGQRGGERDGPQCRRDRVVARRIGDRRDVRDRQSGDRIGAQQCCLHRGLAAHRVADDRGRERPHRLHRFDDVGRHGGVAHVGRVGAGAVVAQVHRDDAVSLGQGSLHRPQVPGHAEQPVQQDDGRAAAGFDGVQDHRAGAAILGASAGTLTGRALWRIWVIVIVCVSRATRRRPRRS